MLSYSIIAEVVRQQCLFVLVAIQPASNLLHAFSSQIIQLKPRDPSV